MEGCSGFACVEQERGKRAGMGAGGVARGSISTKEGDGRGTCRAQLQLSRAEPHPLRNILYSVLYS